MATKREDKKKEAGWMLLAGIVFMLVLGIIGHVGVTLTLNDCGSCLNGATGLYCDYYCPSLFEKLSYNFSQCPKIPSNHS